MSLHMLLKRVIRVQIRLVLCEEGQTVYCFHKNAEVAILAVIKMGIHKR